MALYKHTEEEFLFYIHIKEHGEEDKFEFVTEDEYDDTYMCLMYWSLADKPAIPYLMLALDEGILFAEPDL